MNIGGMPVKRGDALGLAALVTAAGIMFFWRLDSNGWGNGYYAAAAQAGAVNWEAFFFGSSDGGNAITVDKLPASIWLSSLSVRLFGLSSWSLLGPQALLGVGTVVLTYFTVRRHFRHSSAMIAGTVLLLTPAAAVMFRYNNPDALLTFLLTLATYLMIRACEDGRWQWVLGTGAVIGAAFLTKSAQALLLLPTLGGVYLYSGPGQLKRRFLQLVAGLATVAAAAGWWVVIAEATPQESRPYAGGSFSNSFVEVLLRQNGLGRILGSAGGGTPGQEAAPPGLLRLIQYSSFGSQGAWLLPAAVLLLAATLVLLRFQPRCDARRATLLFSGGWILSYWVTFSFMGGVVHAYYLIAIAPPIAMVIGATWEMLRPAQRWVPFRLVAASAVLVCGIVAFGYLSNSSPFGPVLALVVLAFCLVGCELTVFRLRNHRARRFLVVSLVATCGFGPLLFSVSAIASAHTGVSPAASMVGSHAVLDSPDPSLWPDGNTESTRGTALGHLADPQVVAFLRQADNPASRWAAASPGALNAAQYQLTLQRPVMPVGGFNGGTPYPSVSQFSNYIESGQIRYYLVRHDSHDIQAEAGFADEVTNWVREHFAHIQIGEMDVFDLRLRLPNS
ncbi:4-amino-4-deoxy-L-arabinose transferase-like glycosyltransferase [Arthrobacter pascens]|nr:4-amino-4-deoxy-L-arabinose transferase-like glycosyltransferase [Arthrobacter pascens]